jgi:hypothetical protein
MNAGDFMIAAGRIQAACVAACRSGKFETGEGTCAAICMEFLGSPRKSGCPHAVRVHGEHVCAILDATHSTGETKL